MIDPLQILAVFTGLSVFTAGIGFAYAQFKSGAGKAKDDLVQTLRETALAEKEKAERLAAEKLTLVNSHQQQINELNKQIGILQGKAEANEKKMNEYLTILQGRDPDQKKFMELVLAQIKKNEEQASTVQKYMIETGQILEQIRRFMENLNTKSEETAAFQHEVIEATETEQGKVLRK